MDNPVEIEGLGKILDSIRDAGQKYTAGQPRPELEVGYSAPYAIYVHENLEANHPNGGQAKFLEEPLRLLAPLLRKVVAAEVKRGRTLAQALQTAGDFLLVTSQRLVPVRTGFLRDSGYVKVTVQDAAEKGAKSP